MQRSSIEWTHFTSNPLRYRDKDGNVVHACIHASTGCLKCYSEAIAPRYGRAGKPFTAPNMANLTPFLDEKELHSILTYKPASGKMCFLGDMTDIFGEWVPFELIDKIFAVMALRPDVTFQILTKRADRMREYLSEERKFQIVLAGLAMAPTGTDIKVGWPLPNVWLGVSVENQEYADKRIPLLLQTPAAKRFVSYEPALARVSFLEYFYKNLKPTGDFRTRGSQRQMKFKHDGLLGLLHQIIVGGESGPGARPFEPDWARATVQQCKAANVACFVKQMGSNAQTRNDQVADVWYYADGSDMDTEALDGDSYRYQGAPVRLQLKSSKGGNPLEWPEDLRVRQFPEVRA